MKFENIYGTVDVLPDLELYNNKIIGLSMSGGADSTMLCILISKVIEYHQLNTEIQPYNGYDQWAPLDSAGLENIVKFIKEMFPTVSINSPMTVMFDTKGDPVKDKNFYIRPFVKELYDKNFIDIVVPGLTSGPPLEEQQKFDLVDGQQLIQRLPGYRLWDELERVDISLAPLKAVDKRFILQCYKDFGLTELFDMTQSCTHPKGNCGRCWWCKERAWAVNKVFFQKDQL